MKVIERRAQKTGVLLWRKFKCPGCGDCHCLDERWTFNGDFDRPTFKPSVLKHGVPATKAGPDTIDWPGIKRCHSFVTDGRIQFLSNCDHGLAGQTVDLPHVTEID